MNNITPIVGISNREFLETYAGAGRVGLASGSFGVDKIKMISDHKDGSFADSTHFPKPHDGETRRCHPPIP